MNILIVKLSALGDVIQSIPAFEALRRRFPQAHITWLVEEPAAELLASYPGLDEVLVCPRPAWARHLRSPSHWPLIAGEAVQFCRRLRRRDYEVIVDLQGLLKSALWVALARGRRKIGFDGTREGSWRVLNERLPAYDPDRHAQERYLDAARHLGATGNGVSIKPFWSAREAQGVEDRLRTLPLGDCDRLIAVHPVARWTTKLWPEENFAALARELHRRNGAVVVFTGSSGDRKAVRRVLQMAGDGPVFDWAGTVNLRELAYLYSRVKVVVATDSGPMHLAAAVGTPVVALFGPTAPWRTGPFGGGHKVLRSGLDCSPCFQRTCDTMQCMTALSVDEVLQAVAEQLENQ